MSTAVDPSAPHQCGTIEVLPCAAATHWQLPRSCHAAATQLPRSPRGRAMMEAAPSAMHGQRDLQRGALSATLSPRTALGGTVCESSSIFQLCQCRMLMHVHS